MPIETGTVRYKSKLHANTDYCAKCFNKLKIVEKGIKPIENQSEVFIEDNNQEIHNELDNELEDNGNEERHLREGDFFKLNNNIDEDVLHQYYRCNQCLVEPIWGTRFLCSTCDDFDLCEACFDINLEKQNNGELVETCQCANKEWEAIEVSM